MNQRIKKSEWLAVFFITAAICAVVICLKDLEFAL